MQCEKTHRTASDRSKWSFFGPFFLRLDCFRFRFRFFSRLGRRRLLNRQIGSRFVLFARHISETRGIGFPCRGCLARGGGAGFGGARWGGGSGRPTTGKCLFRHGGDCRRGSLWCGGGLGCYSFWRRHDGSGSACRPWVATRRWWKRDFPLLFRGTIHRDFPLL